MKTILASSALAIALVTVSACSSKTADAPQGDATTTAAAGQDAPMTGDPAGDAVRLRGTATAMQGDTLTLTGYQGGDTATVGLGNDTKFAWVEKAQLSDIGDGDFIGTATTGSGDNVRALEVVIFPESMRGSGEGRYAWSTPAVVQQSGGGSGDTAMTNGTVQASTMTNGTVQSDAGGDSAMTNGTVKSSTSGSGMRQLTVGYKGNSEKIAVPDGTPIVRFVPTDRGSLAMGQKLFVVAKPGQPNPAAQFVAMGRNGLTPPM